MQRIAFSFQTTLQGFPIPLPGRLAEPCLYAGGPGRNASFASETDPKLRQCSAVKPFKPDTNQFVRVYRCPIKALSFTAQWLFQVDIFSEVFLDSAVTCAIR